VHRHFKLACGVAAGVLAAGTLAATAYAGSAQPTAALSSNWYAAAPYLMPADNDPPDPATIMDATGQKAFQLAFILSNGGCTPAWDGTTSLDDATSIQSAIDTIRAKGGDVSVSVGGYNGTKLGQVCSDASSTAAAYQQVIDKYQLHAIDFDLEEPEYENTQAIANELGAAKILQANNSGLYVSVTMPGTTAGTGWFGTQLLDEAASIGFMPSNFSIMPFDGGFSGGSSQIAALEAFHGLLESHMGWDSDFAYQHEGFSGMNGRTDAAEYFYQSDFQTVLDYALSHNLGRYTYWSANRDRQCDPPDNNGQLSGSCSGVTQSPWEFTTYTTAFANQTSVVNPPTSSSPSPSPTGGGTGTCAAAAWSASAVYVAGDEVSYNGHTWKAKWWTQGETPGADEWGPWSDEGACTTTSAYQDDSQSGYINGTGDGKQRVLYFDQWSIYQNAYYLKDIDQYADNLDYVIYDFENIDPTNLTCFETTKATDPDPGGESDPNAGDGAGDQFADYEKTFDASTSVNGQADVWGQPIAGNFNQLAELKARHPNLKILLSIGGWTYSKYFSDVAATDASRQKFVSSCIDMFIKGNLPADSGYGGAGTGKGIFDGFDIDWEYPASDGGHVGNHYSTADTANYTALLAEFRSELDAQGAADGKQYTLSAALPGGQDKTALIQTDKIGQYLDFGDVMSYDMHGAWDATGPTNLQDPIFPSADDPSSPVPGGSQQYDADTIMKAYTVGDPEYGIPGGFPANKLNLGIPMYYRGWTGVSAGSDNGLYSTATGPSAGQTLSGGVPGIALQKELDSLGFLSGGKEYYDSQRMAGWYYDGTTFYSGSTPQSIVDHVAYAKCNGLGGVMIFSAYDETPASQPLLEKILSESAGSAPSDCSPYATDTWGTFGPPASASDSTVAQPASGTGNSGSDSPATLAVLPAQRRQA
jgi:GH18 family chitinase